MVQQLHWIQVAQTAEDLQQGKELVFDSKDVKSDQSILVPYDGKPLLSKGVYYWRVKVITNQGSTDWSETNQWSMAFLNDSIGKLPGSAKIPFQIPMKQLKGIRDWLQDICANRLKVRPRLNVPHCIFRD